MFARDVHWAALLLFAALASCSRQEELAGEAAGGEEIVATVGVNVPDVFRTRTLPDVYSGSGAEYLGTSGMPSIGNVDLKNHPLTYTVGVYVEKKKEEGEAPSYALVEKHSATASDDNAYFNFRLLKGQKYTLVAYADFSGAEKKNLEAIPYATGLNDELSDAFFASQEFTAQEDVEVILKRPFGKLRLIARDFDTFAAGEAFRITKVTVAYKRQPMLATDTFNALAGDFNYDETAEGDHTVTADPVVYTREYDPADGSADYAAVFTMYLPANFGDEDTSGQYTPGHGDSPVPQSWFYPFDVTVEYEGANDAQVSGTIERSYTVDIPVKRNWLTTVDAAAFWTDNTGVMVTIDSAFDGEIPAGEAEPVTVNSAAELQAAIDKIFNEAPDGRISAGKIVLGADIDATDRVGFNLSNLKENGTDRSNRGVQVHLDLNGHTITTNGEQYPNWVDDAGEKHFMVGGLFHIEGVNCQLYIDDSNKEQVGGLEFAGEPAYAYPLVCCHNGGQAAIDRGNFITSSPSEAIYVYESEKHRAQVQLWVLNSLKIKSGSTEPKPSDPATLAAVERNVKKWTASVTINGGWYESAIDAATEDQLRVVVNAYNARASYWNVYKNYFLERGYPAWTSWGEYVNQPFGFVFVNGGSFVEFDPSRGDNIVGNVPNKWIGEGHVEQAIVNGKTVYTVIPKEDPRYF